MSNEGELLESVKLTSNECINLLKEALEEQKTRISANITPFASTTTFGSRYEEKWSSDEGDDQQESSSSDSDNDVKAADDTKSDSLTPLSGTLESNKLRKEKRPARNNKPQVDKRRKSAAVRKHVDGLVFDALPLDKDSNRSICLPVALLSKQDRSNAASDPERQLYNVCESFLDVANNLQSKPVVVILLRSGRFAAGVFDSKGKCLFHRVSTRYTVRKGQGKAQSAQDSQRRAQSMGSQLRRAGHIKLQEDIQQTLESWKKFVDEASLLLLGVPKTMLPSFYEGAAPVLDRNDDRIRRIPLDLGRPTYESVSVAYAAMMTVDIRKPSSASGTAMNSVDNAAKGLSKVSIRPKNEVGVLLSVREATEIEEERMIPLTALHVAAKNGDVEVLRDLLQSGEANDGIDSLAGPDLMSPLHYAAEATTHDVTAVAAAEAVSLLLLREPKGSDPAQVDIRNRPPYFLASHDKVRDAFRRARAELGEDLWDWHASKVGPPLTSDDVKARQEKEAEKRRRKRARAKEKKAKDKAESEKVAQQLADQEAKKIQEEEAKRVRDGLQPRVNKANVCDFCQTEVKGRKRSQMFKRLDYKYCSSECVQKHKRELMAKAALSRFG